MAKMRGSKKYLLRAIIEPDEDVEVSPEDVMTSLADRLRVNFNMTGLGLYELTLENDNQAQGLNVDGSDPKGGPDF